MHVNFCYFLHVVNKQQSTIYGRKVIAEHDISRADIETVYKAKNGRKAEYFFMLLAMKNRPS